MKSFLIIIWDWILEPILLAGATDPQYNVLKFNGKAMWGIRLF